MKDLSSLSLDLGSLQSGYLSGQFTPVEVIGEVYSRIRRHQSNPIWIYLVSEEDNLRAAEASPHPVDSPLFGIPFAIKDNIDAEGLPTTAGCPAFSYLAEKDATVVERLRRAGAILIGKTNLDQFATGLVGARSPYGAVSCVFNPAFISGGSSSGSAAAVAASLVSFALGTDTAGSGRVPAAFNNIVGLKPTRGLLSGKGVVPACKSLDCVSLFCLTSADAKFLLSMVMSYDEQDPYSRHAVPDQPSPPRFRIGVPSREVLQIVEPGYRTLFWEAIRRMESLGNTVLEVDISPFLEAAKLLYGGAWIAERFAAVGDFIKTEPEGVHPVVREIILEGEKLSAAETFRSFYKLEKYRQESSVIWNAVDLLLLPTAPEIYRIDQIRNDPVMLNNRLGTFTNFANLLDLSAIALPAGFRADGLPFGITLFGQAFSERLLFDCADIYLEALRLFLGATTVAYPARSAAAEEPLSNRIQVAVVGAHLSGEPLNYQLTERGGRLIRKTKTAPSYQLFELPGTSPPKPGLVRVSCDKGESIELEIWDLPLSETGSFIDRIPSPLTIGTVHLCDGRVAKGFLCEEVAAREALNISEYGGWKAYLKSRAGRSISA
jgi:allophanate hydrolase